MNNFLRNKSIATNKHDENAITFKLYNLNWDLFFDGGKLSIRSSFTLGDDIKMECMVKAINAINNERYIVKSYLNYVFPQDEQGNPIKDASGRTDLVFSFENFCFTESAFCEIYEFAVYAMADAIDYHSKLYNNYWKMQTRAKCLKSDSTAWLTNKVLQQVLWINKKGDVSDSCNIIAD